MHVDCPSLDAAHVAPPGLPALLGHINVDAVLVAVLSDLHGGRFVHGLSPCNSATTPPTIGAVCRCSSARPGRATYVAAGPGPPVFTKPSCPGFAPHNATHHRSLGPRWETKMSGSIADVEAQALQLAPEDRARLADRRLASLSPSAETDEAWSVQVRCAGGKPPRNLAVRRPRPLRRAPAGAAPPPAGCGCSRWRGAAAPASNRLVRRCGPPASPPHGRRCTRRRRCCG